MHRGPRSSCQTESHDPEKNSASSERGSPGESRHELENATPTLPRVAGPWPPCCHRLGACCPWCQCRRPGAGALPSAFWRGLGPASGAASPPRQAANRRAGSAGTVSLRSPHYCRPQGMPRPPGPGPGRPPPRQAAGTVPLPFGQIELCPVRALTSWQKAGGFTPELCPINRPRQKLAATCSTR